MYEVVINRDGGTKQLPCDENCLMEGAAMETCSLHGRNPAEIWEIVERAEKKLKKLEKKYKKALRLINDLTDEDDCEYDHNRACQMHMYFGLEGSNCPHEDAKKLLKKNGIC